MVVIILHADLTSVRFLAKFKQTYVALSKESNQIAPQNLVFQSSCIINIKVLYVLTLKSDKVKQDASIIRESVPVRAAKSEDCGDTGRLEYPPYDLWPVPLMFCAYA